MNKKGTRRLSCNYGALSFRRCTLDRLGEGQDAHPVFQTKSMKSYHSCSIFPVKKTIIFNSITTSSIIIIVVTDVVLVAVVVDNLLSWLSLALDFAMYI